MEQHRYQVRFDWGIAGARAIGADADVVVWVDALGQSDQRDESVETAIAAHCPNAAVITSDLSAAHAAAQWVVNLQVDLGKRIIIAVLAAGAVRAGEQRFAAEDLLAAGAIIDHLAALGLDATSPEAAVAEAAYRGLARATAHLLTAVTSAELDTPQPKQIRVNSGMSVDAVLVLRSSPLLA